MSFQEELTLKEIAQIALGGGSDLKNVNISLLYTIIDLTLKKLNCEHEKVTLSGVAGKNLQELLYKSNVGPPLVFKDEKLKTPMKNYENLDQLEKQIEKLETDLDNHIKSAKYEIVSDNGSDQVPCTLYCEVEEPQNEIIGALIKNKWFTVQLNEFTKMPLTCRFNKLDIKFRKLNKDIEQFKIDSMLAHRRIDKMEEIFVNLLEFQKTIRENYTEFITTMEEIQEVMNLKVNNVEMPPIKNSFQTLINRLTHEINYMKYVKTRPRALLCIAEPKSQGKIPKSVLQKFSKDLRADTSKALPCGCDEAWLHPTLLLERLDKEFIFRTSTIERVSFHYTGNLKTKENSNQELKKN